MKPSDVLAKERIIMNIAGEGKNEVLEKMVHAAGTSKKVIGESAPSRFPERLRC